CVPTCSRMDVGPSCSNGASYPGCQCKQGMLPENNKCYLPKDCPCKYRGEDFPADYVVQNECNFCKCFYGSWQCTKNECPKTCSVFGLEHVTTFD
ncbi:hypothetical protein HELRODRAFT_136702, partial [Helobdella robusta]|uniref:TIL domain-containing protein n=1 Tax=Helobdella robusta TaxID=6412 RepID=T1EIF4_HELRO